MHRLNHQTNLGNSGERIGALRPAVSQSQYVSGVAGGIDSEISRRIADAGR
jgi:hypothetical protein